MKLILKKIIPYNYRLKLKRLLRKTSSRVKGANKNRISLEQYRILLIEEFCIRKGDTIIVSSSFGNLNADFSPLELVVCLQNLVGEEGNIVMPFYPPGNSYEWAKSGKVFDMKTTRSSMGILTQVFSESENVHKSKHPTKAVVAWGNNAKEIVSGHEKSKTPFYWDSPYGWLLKYKSKSLGLGLKNIPIFHAFEDVLLNEEEYLYYSKKSSLEIKSYNNNVEQISVLVHDPKKISKLMDAGDYTRLVKPQSYKRINIGLSFCYIVDNDDLFSICKEEFSLGNFRYKK